MYPVILIASALGLMVVAILLWMRHDRKRRIAEAKARDAREAVYLWNQESRRKAEAMRVRPIPFPDLPLRGRVEGRSALTQPVPAPAPVPAASDNSGLLMGMALGYMAAPRGEEHHHHHEPAAVAEPPALEAGGGSYGGGGASGSWDPPSSPSSDSGGSSDSGSSSSSDSGGGGSSD